MSKGLRPTLLAIPGIVNPEDAAPAPDAAISRIGAKPPSEESREQSMANQQSTKRGRVQLGIRVDPAVSDRLATIAFKRGRMKTQQLFDEMIERFLEENPE